MFDCTWIDAANGTAYRSGHQVNRNAIGSSRNVWMCRRILSWRYVDFTIIKIREILRVGKKNFERHFEAPACVIFIHKYIYRIHSATEIQNIQIAEGNVCVKLQIPIYMIFPRLFTCPTLISKNFKVGKFITSIKGT